MPEEWEVGERKFRSVKWMADENLIPTQPTDCSRFSRFCRRDSKVASLRWVNPSLVDETEEITRGFKLRACVYKDFAEVYRR
ncbi:hypothetical protein HI914_02923 [Erysiphe necator]|nr:hypothetical protein HI914_02923 [Erysiphe necator]